MLKKLFLPLFAICALGFTLIHANPTFATDDPCEKIYAKGTQGYTYCTQHSAEWQAWRAEQKAAEDKENIWRSNNCSTLSENNLNHCGQIQDGTREQQCNKCRELKAGGYNGPDGTWLPKAKINSGATIDDLNPDGRNNEDESEKERVDQNPQSDLRPDELPEKSNNPAAPTELKSSCDRAAFLGLTSWDCGTNFEAINSENQLPILIMTIANNIFEDITIIATYLIIGYIIYGGYLYIFANGDTGKVATGKKALNQAFIGLAITLSAEIIIETIRVIMLHADGAFTDVEYLKNGLSAGEMVSSVIQWVIGIAGVVSLVFVVGGGIMYMTSAGEPSKLQTAKNIIKYALIGLVIVALSETITIFMTNIIKGSNDSSNSAYIINEKEFHENNKIS